MTTFKSFKPKQFATKKRNGYCDRTKVQGKQLNELCANCGYPWGEHGLFDDNCPDPIEAQSFEIKPCHVEKT